VSDHRSPRRLRVLHVVEPIGFFDWQYNVSFAESGDVVDDYIAFMQEHHFNRRLGGKVVA
jgi:hypothetical protein